MHIVLFFSKLAKRGVHMKWLLGISLCGTLALQAQQPAAPSHAQKQPQPAYDADLFRRDVPVFSAHAGFLYWRVQEGALDYALKMQNTAWSTSANCFASGDFEKVTFNGDPGFRVALSYFRAPNYWEIFGKYTRLTARGNDAAVKPDNPNEFLTGTWPELLGTNVPLTGANSYIHLNYNVADLLVDRYFNPNPHLRLRLLGGATMTWMNQDWIIRYYNSLGQITKIDNRWRYIGGGFRVGTWVDWFWTRDLYMTAEMTTSILLGSYQNWSKQWAGSASQAGDNLTIPVRDTRYSDIRPTFCVQALVGPSWQKNFTNYRVEVFAGYELNTWFNIHEVYRSTAGTPSATKETLINTGLLTLQGLTTRVTVDF